MTGRAVAQTQARSLYVETTLRLALRQMNHLRKRRDQDMFCLNDGSFPEISDEVRVAAVTDFLELYFPIAAPWERESETAGRAASAGPGSVWSSAVHGTLAEYPQE